MNTVSNLEKIDLSHILFHPDFVSCLTCKRFFGHTTATSGEYNALTHVKGKKHRKIVKSLFKNSINDPFCISSDEKYLVVLKNLKLDISQLAQGGPQTTYIYERNEHLFCSVCQEVVSNYSNIDLIKTDLFHHLDVKIESHMAVIKDSASWIYKLNNGNGFLLFKSTKVYCSVCDIDLDFVENLMLHAAVGHMQTSQHKIKLFEASAQDLIVNAHGSGGHGLSALPKQVNVEDNQIGQQFVNNHVNIDKMTLDSIISLAQDPMFAPHVQFLKIEGGNFICTLCDVPLTISTSKAHHLKEHILGSPHGKRSSEQHISIPNQSELGSTDGIQLIGTTPQDQIQKLALEPKFAAHVKYLQVKGLVCRCLLCDVTLSVSVKVNHNLKDHLLGSKHANRFLMMDPNHVKESLNIIGEASSTGPVDQVESMALPPDPVLIPHLKYVEKNENHYRCLLCNIPIHSHQSLKEHLLGEKHKKRVGKSVPLTNQSITQNINLFKKLAENPVCAPHIKYLTVVGKQCLCFVCGAVIPVSQKGVRLHILGAKHIKCLGKLQPGSGIVPRQLSTNGQHIDSLRQDPRCAPHLPYVMVNDIHCYCSICCVFIPMEKNGFMHHILETKHTVRFDKLQLSNVQERETSNDQNIVTTAIAELKKLAQDPRCARHLQYFKEEKKQYRCSLCGVLVANRERDVKLHILGKKHSNCLELVK